ncbi:MAG TPA: enoyl-CoA hydratase-related protein [Polyangiaceae bacterium]|nr:enoyl-CoA hydratase-related protein [Polyangiaceae bacterium]
MSESPARDLQIEDHGAVRLIRLVRPGAKNALTLGTVEELIAALAAAGGAPSVRAVVLSGTRGAFCSGADLRWLTQALDSGEPMGPGLERFQALSLGVVELGKPVVAAVTGPAVGFGADLALACDFRVLAESAYLQEKFAAIGLMPDGGGSYFLTRLLGPARALEMLMLGSRIDAAQAVSLGLATSMTDDADTERAALALAATLSQAAPLALSRIKHAVHANASELRAALGRERAGQLELLQSADVREGVRAFLERRTPVFRGN